MIVLDARAMHMAGIALGRSIDGIKQVRESGDELTQQNDDDLIASLQNVQQWFFGGKRASRDDWLLAIEYLRHEADDAARLEPDPFFDVEPPEVFVRHVREAADWLEKGFKDDD